MLEPGDKVTIINPLTVFDGRKESWLSDAIVLGVLDGGKARVYLPAHDSTYILPLNDIKPLKPKHRYPWERAPNWAICAATDENGERYWYERTPFAESEWFSGTDGRYAPICENAPDWKESLELRPDEFKAKPKPETKPKEMTVAEIEKALGHPVKVVK